MLLLAFVHRLDAASFQIVQISDPRMEVSSREYSPCGRGIRI